MEFGFMACAKATTVLLAGVTEALVPVVARSQEEAAIELKTALRSARTLDTVLARVDVDGGTLDRENARAVAKGLADGLQEARSCIAGLTPATERALESACDCARALHRALAGSGSSEVMGARVLAHGLDTASTLAGVLTLELGVVGSHDEDCAKARRLSLSLARARDLAADSSLPALAVELARARSLALSLATTPQAEGRGMPLWIFFALGRALGRLDAALADGEVEGGALAKGEVRLVVGLDLPVVVSQEPTVEWATKLCTSLGELHVARGGCSLVPDGRPAPREGEPGRVLVELRLIGAEGEALGCKSWIEQQIRRMHAREQAAAAVRVRERGRTTRLKSKSWTPLDPEALVQEVCNALEWAAFLNEQGHIASRLAEPTAEAAPPPEAVVDDGRSPWSAPAQRAVAAMLALQDSGAITQLWADAG